MSLLYYQKTTDSLRSSGVPNRPRLLCISVSDKPKSSPPLSGLLFLLETIDQINNSADQKHHHHTNDQGLKSAYEGDRLS